MSKILTVWWRPQIWNNICTSNNRFVFDETYQSNPIPIFLVIHPEEIEVRLFGQRDVLELRVEDVRKTRGRSWPRVTRPPIQFCQASRSTPGQRCERSHSCQRRNTFFEKRKLRKTNFAAQNWRTVFALATQQQQQQQRERLNCLLCRR